MKRAEFDPYWLRGWKQAPPKFRPVAQLMSTTYPTAGCRVSSVCGIAACWWFHHRWKSFCAEFHFFWYPGVKRITPSVLWCCWLGGRKGIGPEWLGAGILICLERGADIHMAQLMPLSLTVSCFSKIQICFTFLVPAHLRSPGKGPLNGCVCVCVGVKRKMCLKC